MLGSACFSNLTSWQLSVSLSSGCAPLYLSFAKLLYHLFKSKTCSANLGTNFVGWYWEWKSISSRTVQQSFCNPYPIKINADIENLSNVTSHWVNLNRSNQEMLWCVTVMMAWEGEPSLLHTALFALSPDSRPPTLGSNLEAQQHPALAPPPPCRPGSQCPGRGERFVCGHCSRFSAEMAVSGTD